MLNIQNLIWLTVYKFNCAWLYSQKPPRILNLKCNTDYTMVSFWEIFVALSINLLVNDGEFIPFTHHNRIIGKMQQNVQLSRNHRPFHFLQNSTEVLLRDAWRVRISTVNICHQFHLFISLSAVCSRLCFWFFPLFWSVSSSKICIFLARYQTPMSNSTPINMKAKKK